MQRLAGGIWNLEGLRPAGRPADQNDVPLRDPESYGDGAHHSGRRLAVYCPLRHPDDEHAVM